MTTRDVELVTTCKKCGREFEPTHDDYVRGRWRICPDCRQLEDPDNLPRADTEPSMGAMKGTTDGR